MKWVSVATAPNQPIAEMWCELLRNEGVPAMVKAADAVSFIGVSGTTCRVTVPEDRRDEALVILQGVGADIELPEDEDRG